MVCFFLSCSHCGFIVIYDDHYFFYFLFFFFLMIITFIHPLLIHPLKKYIYFIDRDYAKGVIASASEDFILKSNGKTINDKLSSLTSTTACLKGLIKTKIIVIFVLFFVVFSFFFFLLLIFFSKALKELCVKHFLIESLKTANGALNSPIGFPHFSIEGVKTKPN